MSVSFPWMSIVFLCGTQCLGDMFLQGADMCGSARLCLAFLTSNFALFRAFSPFAPNLAWDSTGSRCLLSDETQRNRKFGARTGRRGGEHKLHTGHEQHVFNSPKTCLHTLTLYCDGFFFFFFFLRKTTILKFNQKHVIMLVVDLLRRLGALVHSHSEWFLGGNPLHAITI